MSHFDAGPSRDTCFPSNKVYGLNLKHFGNFLNSKDVVMVMFYDAHTTTQKKVFAEAAEETCRHNHAYAAVNCDTECELCQQEGAWKFPTYKLYQKHRIIDAISDVKEFGDLKYLIEGPPNTPPPPPPPPPRWSVQPPRR